MEKNWIVHFQFIVLFVSILAVFYLLNQKIEKNISKTDEIYEIFIDLITEEKKWMSEINKSTNFY